MILAGVFTGSEDEDVVDEDESEEEAEVEVEGGGCEEEGGAPRAAAAEWGSCANDACAIAISRSP